MKKISILALSFALLVSVTPIIVQAKTKAAVHQVKKKTPKTITSLKWTSSALQALGSFASFDYNNSIRNAYIKKIEASAKKKHLKTVTATFVKNFRG